MAALPFCFIYPQSEGRGSFGPRFALGYKTILALCQMLGEKSKTTKLNKGVHSMKQNCVLLVAIYIDGCFYR